MMRRTFLRRIIYGLLGVSMMVVATFVWLASRPIPVWGVPVKLGSTRVILPAADMLRLATHPYVIRAMSGRHFATRYGKISFLQREGTLLVRCVPCTLRANSISSEPVRLAYLDFTVHREGELLHGTLASGQVMLHWQGRLGDDQLFITGELPATRADAVYALFANDIPELQHARIEGTFATRFSLSLPDGIWQVQPDMRITAVYGLGTEALRGVRPVPRCARQSVNGFGPRMAAAVIAAEDQRFWEHAGYDPVELAAALTPDPTHQNGLRGASTLDEQVARMVYTGARHNPTRKLREILYAVEMNRTLGKAQILQLYLALAPWGDGTCGAEAAAQHYFGKPARALQTQEAAWLASLLRNPAMAHTAPEKVSGHAVWVLHWMKNVSPAEKRNARRILKDGAGVQLTTL